MSEDNRNALPQGHVVGEYRIERVLGAGGFGITYLAVEGETGRRVALKEYLPPSLARRLADGVSVAAIGAGEAETFEWGLDRFLGEARTLLNFDHPAIVRTLRFFRANGTAYLAMEYVEGKSLSALLEREGRLSESRMRGVLAPLLDGLAQVHAAGFLHRDIKPDNIVIRADSGRADGGAPVLIDFGAARQAIGRSGQSLTAIISDGYAPFEQYGGDGDQGPWTDIYALGATAYRCITGERPVSAPLRVRALMAGKPDPLVPASVRGGAGYSAPLLAAIDYALATREAERPQSVAAWRIGMDDRGPAATSGKRETKGSETLVPDAALDRPPAIKPEKTAGRPWRWAAAVLVLAALGGGAVLADAQGWLGGGRSREAAARLERERITAERRAQEEREAREKAEREAAEKSRPGHVFRDCAECPEMVVIPTGAFTMGSPPHEREREGDEGPQIRVSISIRFAMGKHEITFAEWDACVADGGCRHRPGDEGWGRGRQPVMNVSWDDAQEYVAWLSRKTGKRYRLPSEAEWEYAARAGTTTPFHTGETISTDQANYNGTLDYGPSAKGQYRVQTTPVGQFPPNRFGLHDVHGNVWEWVEDCWEGNYNPNRSQSAWQRGDCNRRVVRGGSWSSVPGFLRSANRLRIDAVGRVNEVGFRVARTM